MLRTIDSSLLASVSGGGKDEPSTTNPTGGLSDDQKKLFEGALNDIELRKCALISMRGQQYIDDKAVQVGKALQFQSNKCMTDLRGGLLPAPAAK